MKRIDNEICYDEIGSTNVELKKLVKSKDSRIKNGLLVSAKKQTGGRGRMGRSFFSPDGTGIYMSVLFSTKNKKASDVVMVTSMAAVAVCLAIEKITQKKVGIKWVNDIIYENKKIAGILTEAISDASVCDGIAYTIVGIGVNVCSPKDGFPEDIKGIAGTLCKEDEIDDKLIENLKKEIYSNLLLFFENIEKRSFIDEYKKRSIVLDKEISFVRENVSTKAKAIDIDNDGGLVVQLLDTKKNLVLNTGEISVRF